MNAFDAIGKSKDIKGMLTDLDAANMDAHAGQPRAFPEAVATVWKEDTPFVQVCFQSRGCRYSERGACIMCDYGRGRMLTADQVARYCEEAEVFRRRDISELLIGSYGSALDDGEISRECFRIILERLRDAPVPMVGFETHCDTVSEERLEEIRTYLPEKCIYIEMGFESANDTVREKYLNKKLRLPNLLRAMDCVRRTGFLTILNVLLGSPFLSPREQIEDVVASVQWAFAHGADHIVLFPMNVKPYTALYGLMQAGRYRPISYWRLAAALYALSLVLTPDQLAHVGLSWYGERGDIYPEGYPRMIPPVCCPRCRNVLFSFYQAYQNTVSGTQRKRMIEQMLTKTVDCSCRDEEWSALKI